ncbi:MAG: delta-60 repeat domain-containing protein, partial [Acidimicrobiia bacterium]
MFVARRLAVAILALAWAALPAAAAPGDLDSTFGMGGIQRTNFGGTYDWAYAVAIQPDGKIVAAGVSNAGKTYDFALARYTADRTLDAT